MNFCNLIKGFVYHGHQFNFTYCEQDGGKNELFIYADDEKGKELKQFVMKLIIFMLTMSQLGEAPPA